MNLIQCKRTWLIAVLAAVTILGCGKDDSATDEALKPIVMNEPPPFFDEGAHPDHGPNGGELIELGKEAFHIELLHGSGVVTMYVLDGSATKTVAINADPLMVSLKRNGKVKSFPLAADPQPQDPPGKSAKFTSTDKEMEQWMDAGAEGAVVVEINGRSYTGSIAHHHDH